MRLLYLFWSKLVLIGTATWSNAAYLRCYRNTIDDFEIATLDEPEILLNTSCYNVALPNVIYAFGFNGKVNGPATTNVLTAAVSLTDRNVFLLDWQEEASAIEMFGNIGRQISYVLFGLQQSIWVGNRLGRALVTLSKYGLDLSKTHLVAHSLGAHMMGNAGRYVIDQGQIIARITGLDPAGPFFDSYYPRYPPLDKSCASFVDTIHTDPGGRYALNSSFATVDIWPNFGNFIEGSKEDQVQPGCPKGNLEMFSREDMCSHDRSWMLMVESWLRNDTLMASRADDYHQWKIQGHYSEVIIMGDKIDRNATGNYYMSTNEQPPYGRGERGLMP